MAVPAAPAIPRRGSPVQGWELGGLTLLLGVYLAALAVLGAAGADVVNIAGPAAMGLILGFGALAPVLRDPAEIWTPLFWFRIAALAYFSFGNVATYFLSPESKAELEGFFADYMGQVTKLNAVTTLGVLLVLAAAFVTDRLRTGGSAAEPGEAEGAIASPRALFLTGAIFAAVGEVVKFVFVVPVAFGLTDQLLPGAISSLALLSSAGIYLLAVWAWNFRPGLLAVPVLLTLVDVGVSLLQFAKSDVIAAIMMLALAWLSKGATLRRLAVCALVVTATFGLIVPFVEGGRREMVSRHQGLGGADFAERMEISGDVFDPGEKGVASADEGARQAGLMRFSYVNAGSLAIYLHDSGQAGTSLATLPAAFIPRAVWPDKPNMTEIGNQFNYLANGNYDSASSPGWFAEAYWNLGWLGLPLLMIPAGVLLQLWGAFTLGVLHRGEWLFFPFCLLGMRTGMRVDGFLVPDLVGTAVIAACGYLLLRLVRDAYLPFAGAATSAR